MAKDITKLEQQLTDIHQMCLAEIRGDQQIIIVLTDKDGQYLCSSTASKAVVRNNLFNVAKGMQDE